MNKKAESYKTIISWIALVGLSLITLLSASLPMQAMVAHDMKSEGMTYEQHVNDCVAACGTIDKAEKKQVTVSKRKKEREKQPDKPQSISAGITYKDHSHVHRTVYTKNQSKIYLQIALLRL